jgi:hypothetical protein
MMASSVRPVKLSGFIASSHTVFSSMRRVKRWGEIASGLRVGPQRHQYTAQGTGEQITK